MSTGIADRPRDADDRKEYADTLRGVVPQRYMSSRHWDFVKTSSFSNEKWGTPESVRVRKG